MKLRFFIIIIALLTSANVFSQVKPKVMVFPSNRLLKNMGFLEIVDDMGERVQIPNYHDALLDDDLADCIAKINEMFAKRDFRLEDLNQRLQDIQGKKGKRVEYDIRVELSYTMSKQGPRDILQFTLEAFDAYSGESFSTTSGESKPAIGASKVSLLQEAVVDRFDYFADGMQQYFETVQETGRYSRLTIEAADGVELPDNLEIIVNKWLKQNCVNGKFHLDVWDETTLSYSNAKMPLFDAERSDLDAYHFYHPLAEILGNQLDGYNVSHRASAKNSGSRGNILGDAYMLISQ